MPAPRVHLSFSVLLVSLLTAAPALAGPVTGRVVDPDGRGVPGAEVMLTSGSSVLSRAVSGSSGRFTLQAPDAGEFVLRVAIQGFRATPVPVAGAREGRDVGPVPLALSAVLESVVVSAAQVEVPLSTASSSVTVITGEDLTRRQIESVADALRLVPGLSIAATGGRGAATSVFPRGGESDYSLVLVDGIQANAFGGGFDFAHLPVANIERIEIVRGPQSALYGSNAIGAVIRIITRQSGAPTGAATIEGGSFGTSRAAAASSGGLGSWNWGASAERLASDGFNGSKTRRGETVVNDDYARHSLSGSAGWHRSADTFLRGDVQYARDERGFPGPFGSDPGGTFEGLDTVSRGRVDRWLMSVGGSAPVGQVRTHVEATHARIEGDFVSAFGPSDTWSRRTTVRLQGDLRLTADLESSFGTEHQQERAGGTFITTTGSRPVPVRRGLTGIFGEIRWNRRARLFVTTGVRAERISRRALAEDSNPFAPRPPFDEDTIVSVNPKVSGAWFLESRGGSFTKVRAAAGTGIRPPDAFEIAFTDNPSLKPERSRSAEVGLDRAFLGGLALVETTAFFNSYDDLIVAVGSFAESSRYRTDNISNARSRGLEIAATARARTARPYLPQIHLRVAYTLLRTEILAADGSSATQSPFTPGDRLLRRPGHQFSTDLTMEAGRFTAFVQGGGRARVLDVDPTLGTFGGLHQVAGYATWTAGAAWRLRTGVEVFGRVTNMFDRRYEEALGFPAPGRGAMAGLRVAAGR